LDGELAEYETWDDARSNIFIRGLIRNENEWSKSSKPLYQVWRLADRWQDHQIGCELGAQRNRQRGPQLNRAGSGTRAITCRDLGASANARTRAAASRIIEAVANSGTKAVADKVLSSTLSSGPGAISGRITDAWELLLFSFNMNSIIWTDSASDQPQVRAKVRAKHAHLTFG